MTVQRQVLINFGFDEDGLILEGEVTIPADGGILEGRSKEFEVLRGYGLVLKASVPCAAMGYCWRERFSLRVESFLR